MSTPGADRTGPRPPEPPAAWVALVHGADRPGTLTAVTGVFSARGVSFDHLSTGTGEGGRGTIAVTFTATPRRRTLLVRTVARLAAVHDVVVRAADDPAVRAAGIVRMPDGAALPGTAGGVGVVGTPGAGTMLVEGSLAQVADVVARARAAGATTATTVVLGL